MIFLFKEENDRLKSIIQSGQFTAYMEPKMIENLSQKGINF